MAYHKVWEKLDRGENLSLEPLRLGRIRKASDLAVMAFAAIMALGPIAYSQTDNFVAERNKFFNSIQRVTIARFGVNP